MNGTIGMICLTILCLAAMYFAHKEGDKEDDEDNKKDRKK